jgi:hypothetical protein
MLSKRRLPILAISVCVAVLFDLATIGSHGPLLFHVVLVSLTTVVVLGLLWIMSFMWSPSEDLAGTYHIEWIVKALMRWGVHTVLVTVLAFFVGGFGAAIAWLVLSGGVRIFLHKRTHRASDTRAGDRPAGQ